MPPSSRTDVEVARGGVAAFAAATATFLAIAGVGGGTRLAMVLAAVIGLGLGALLGARVVGLGPDELGLRRPRALVLLGALLIGATFWYLNLVLTEPLSRMLRGEAELAGLRQRWVEQVPLAITLLTVALVPAVCEELACRGLLVGALARRLSVVATVLVSATLFALLHLSVVRFAPTLLLGAVLAAVRVRTREVWSPMLIHLLNNAAALVAIASPGAAWVAWIGNHPGLAFVLAAGGAATGMAILVVATRNSASPARAEVIELR